MIIKGEVYRIIKLLETINNKNRDSLFDDIEKVLKNVYDAGFKAKRCREDNDNPYHIDHKRQTKIDF